MLGGMAMNKIVVKKHAIYKVLKTAGAIPDFRESLVFLEGRAWRIGCIRFYLSETTKSGRTRAI